MLVLCVLLDRSSRARTDNYLPRPPSPSEEMLLALFTVVAGFLSGVSSVSSGRAPPHIILIVVDDLG